MRTKITLVLLLLNLVLFFFIFQFERVWRAERQFAQTKKRVLGPEAAYIRSLEIHSTAAPDPISLERTPEGWRLIHPISWPANPNAVSRILNELQFLEQETSFPVSELAGAGQSLADYGLEHPRMTVAFQGGENRVELKVGEVTHVGNRLYVLSPDGRRIHVVGRSLADSLSLPLSQLRSDSLFTIPPFEVRSVGLQTSAASNVKVRLSRLDTRWLFEAPITTRADDQAVAQFISRLHLLKVVSFEEARNPDANRYGLLNPALRITIEGNDRRETLFLGQTADADPQNPVVYAKLEDRPAVFTVRVPEALISAARHAQDQLRERRILEFNPDRVSSISLASPARTPITLQRLETGRWQIIARPPNEALQTYPADEKQVERLLGRLALLRAEGFESDAPSAADLENFGFNRPEREITLTFSPGDSQTPAPPPQTLRVGLNLQGRLFAMRANAPFVYAVPSNILRDTPTVAGVYRDRLLRELPPGAAIIGMVLSSLGDNAVIFSHELASRDQTWEATLPEMPSARRSAVLALLAEMRRLRAGRFTHESFVPIVEVGGEHRAWKYLLEIKVSLVGAESGQSSWQPLYFSDRLSGGTLLVGSPEFNVVFAATQELLDAVFDLTYQPVSPAIPEVGLHP